MGDNKAPAKPELGILEEDDEFEEFPAEGIYFVMFIDREFVYLILLIIIQNTGTNITRYIKKVMRVIF